MISIYAVSNCYIVYLETICSKDLVLEFHFPGITRNEMMLLQTIFNLWSLNTFEKKYPFLCAHYYA